MIKCRVTLCRAGYGSESEAEDEAATIQLSTDIGRLNRQSQRSAVKLQEIGPRMTMQLVKVEEGLCSGAIIFHEYSKILSLHTAIYWYENDKEQNSIKLYQLILLVFY